MVRPRRSIPHLIPVLFLALATLTGCGDDGGGTGPGAEPSHYDFTLKMSSILAVEDCETTPGNPGEFVWPTTHSAPTACSPPTSARR